MRMRERVAWVAAFLGLLGVLQSGRGDRRQRSLPNRPHAPAGVRLSMDALHQQGGVPLGWQMALAPGDPAAGRELFVESGCDSCHRIAGESFAHAAADDRRGPELSGMGSHHPPAYFAEAILNPNAVLIDAPGYLGPDGRSTMPAYPEMSVAELSDMVAYLSSLKQDGMASCHAGGNLSAGSLTVSTLDLRNRPTPPQTAARRFFVQSYDVLPGQLAAFEQWFDSDGRRQFLSVNGLLSLDTFVDATRSTGSVTSLFGFRDEAALRNFMGDPASANLWKQFDAFIGPHSHQIYNAPSLYRAPSLSLAE